MNNRKIHHRLLFTLLRLFTGGCAGSGSVSQVSMQGPPQVSITYQTFYEELSP